MIYELSNTEKAAPLFEGWEDTLIYSCLQKVMGKIWVTDPDNPRSAMAFAGGFAFLAGEPDRQLVLGKPEGFVILIPQNAQWEACIRECFPDSRKVTRYAIRKDTRFDVPRLRELAAQLPEGYELKEIDADLYDMCLADPVIEDFVAAFESKEQFLKLGRGVAVLKEGRIVSGASSYTRYREGIEIEVITREAERRRGLAGAACAALILRCLEEGLYPSWDARTRISVHLAEKLGYVFDHEYAAYEVPGRSGPHGPAAEKSV